MTTCAQCSAIAIAVFLIGLALPTGAQAREAPNCTRRDVLFNGVARLQYARVSGANDAKLYLHKRFPTSCTSSNPESCMSPSYLIGGDTVAVGKICGTWAFVQYIGQQHISIGWVVAAKLVDLPAGTLGAEGKRYRFALTKGQGAPVCEAYLQRLNQTGFARPPYCDRPESDVVPGFAVLNRRYLTRAEFVTIQADVMNVLQNFPPDYYQPLPTPEDFRPAAWRYDPPVDIENAGHPDNVVIWNRNSRDFPMLGCGSRNARNNVRMPGDHAGIILSPGGEHVDRRRTLAVFAFTHLPEHPSGGKVEFGQAYAVFQYRGTTYFDTFLDTGEGDFDGRREGDYKLSDTLAVFLFENDSRREMCEYYVHDLDLED